MNKVAIYCRLSSEDRDKQSAGDDSVSIQNQKMMLINYCVSHGWEIYNIYSDDDYAGSDRKRPEFNRLLKDAEERKFNIVLCKSQSRFTRELEYVEKYIHGLFLEWNIRFIGVVDQADTDNAGNKKSRQINGLVNEWYLEDLSNNIRGVFDERRKKGLHIGSFSVYGYKKDPDEKGHLIIDEEAAEVVRLIFNLFEQGLGKSAICRELNARRIPNPTGYKKSQGLKYHNGNNDARSTFWQYYVIDYILRNEMYIGNMVQGKVRNLSYKSTKKIYIPKENWIVVEGTHEPIIQKEQWDRVQKLLAKRAGGWSNTGHVGLFARKTVCMYCGYTMRSQKNRQYYYLRCSSYFISRDICTGSFIKQRELESIVFQEWKKLVTTYLDKGEVAKGIVRSSVEDQIKSCNKEIAQIKKHIEKTEKALKNLYYDKSDGTITKEEYLKFKEEFQEELLNFNKESLQLMDNIKELETKKRAMKSNLELISEYADCPQLSREIVQNFIDYIEIGRRDGVSGEVPINIHWNI